MFCPCNDKNQGIADANQGLLASDNPIAAVPDISPHGDAAERRSGSFCFQSVRNLLTDDCNRTLSFRCIPAPTDRAEREVSQEWKGALQFELLTRLFNVCFGTCAR
jgi:hypothetical protein